MTKSQAQTLGQRIDTVLEPLYEEADQHRATIELVKEQQAKLQEQVDAAEAGLSQIESRMAEVVRAMAQQEPVIAAVVGGSAETPATPEPAEPGTEDEPAFEATPEPEAAVVEEPAPVADTITEDAAAEAEEAPADETPEPETPEIELDPVADAAAVDEAAAMLDSLPEAESDPEAQQIDLTAAAERAAAAAKQLREKAGTQ